MKKPVDECTVEELAVAIKQKRLTEASIEELEEELRDKLDKAYKSMSNVEPTKKYVDVEALLANRENVSPPVELEINGKKHRVVFRELSREDMHGIEASATGYIVKLNEKSELPYEHIHSPECQERLTSEKEIRMLCMWSLKAKLGPPTPAFDLDWLRANIKAREQNAACRKWEAWFERDRWSVSDLLNEDDLTFMVEATKKNDVSFWINCEFHMLISFARTLVNRLEQLQTESASDS